eukprot:TRINITY_DN31401_c1_g1_i3.p2 TRINITY_DN31401_c1_g1~~TRINITY_DN31401_c1_g1_i3.p2  ORF type:complete len:302 (-),score=-35.30 TRINITY_DN31401_c1_g1_i3:148-963(-)
MHIVCYIIFLRQHIQYFQTQNSIHKLKSCFQALWMVLYKHQNHAFKHYGQYYTNIIKYITHAQQSNLKRSHVHMNILIHKQEYTYPNILKQVIKNFKTTRSHVRYVHCIHSLSKYCSDPINSYNATNHIKNGATYSYTYLTFHLTSLSAPIIYTTNLICSFFSFLFVLYYSTLCQNYFGFFGTILEICKSSIRPRSSSKQFKQNLQLNDFIIFLRSHSNMVFQSVRSEATTYPQKHRYASICNRCSFSTSAHYIQTRQRHQFVKTYPKNKK